MKFDIVTQWVTAHSENYAYRDKTKIEDVFKNVKSFLKLRPFFVNTDNHVKAVYTICIIAYFINKYLANQRKAAGEKDFLNSKELLLLSKISITLLWKIKIQAIPLKRQLNFPLVQKDY